jgi:SWI2/SNF2 ATPase
VAEAIEDDRNKRTLELVESAHPDVGKLSVFWHTQGNGKSYSMAFFTEKVRRQVSAKFTFLLMTDRNDLDSQIYRTFVGCGIPEDKTPRAAAGEELKHLLQQNHRYVFRLIHKLNQHANPREPYSDSDDIIVIFGRGAPDAGGQARAQHAGGVAECGVHRFYRHVALSARQSDQAHPAIALGSARRLSMY